MTDDEVFEEAVTILEDCYKLCQSPKIDYPEKALFVIGQVNGQLSVALTLIARSRKGAQDVE